MPEGPEVRIMAKWLEKTIFNGISLDGRAPVKLSRINALSGRYTKNGRFEQLSVLNQFPRTVKEVKVYGKFLWLDCEGDHHLCFTMGMTGNFSKTQDRWSRIELVFDSSTVFFTDKRNFGTVRVLKTEALNRKLETLGFDPLDQRLDKLTVLNLVNIWPKLTMAQFLMSQSVVAGIGNYLKAEVLYAAKISPHRLAGSLAASEISTLTAAINEVTRASFENNGASLRDYVTPDNDRGNFADLLKVYRKKVDPLGNPVTKEVTKDKRSTHWVPAIQK